MVFKTNSGLYMLEQVNLKRTLNNIWMQIESLENAKKFQYNVLKLADRVDTVPQDKEKIIKAIDSIDQKSASLIRDWWTVFYDISKKERTEYLKTHKQPKRKIERSQKIKKSNEIIELEQLYQTTDGPSRLSKVEFIDQITKKITGYPVKAYGKYLRKTRVKKNVPI